MNTAEGMAAALKACAMDLKAWCSATFRQIPKKIQEKRKRLSNLVQLDRDGQLGEEINQVRKDINDLIDSEEIYWCQRSKAHWLREGDRNTKFFHAQASERRKQNTILGIWDIFNSWCGDQDSIARAAIKEVNFVPYRLIQPVYTVPASKPVQIPPLFHIGKNTSRTNEIRLFRPVNAYRTEKRKRRRKKKKKHSHSLISPLIGVTHSFSNS